MFTAYITKGFTSVLQQGLRKSWQYSSVYQKICQPQVLCQAHTEIQSLVSFHTSHRHHVLENNTTKSLTIWNNVKELKSSPMPALVLGLSGLVPFIAAPSFLIMNGYFCPNIAFAQLAYGASILSFLGGVRWGFTLPEENPVQPDWVNLGYSVLPSLAACGSLLLPPTLGIFTVIGGLGFAAFFDLSMYGYPSWFKGLRFVLSFVAILSLWSTFMCSIMLSKNEDTKLIEEN